jgi:hypothetical protein
MLALAFVLFILWIVSFVVFKVTGVLVHLFLLLAAIAFVWRLVSGRRPIGRAP